VGTAGKFYLSGLRVVNFLPILRPVEFNKNSHKFVSLKSLCPALTINTRLRLSAPNQVRNRQDPLQAADLKGVT
jgi:hypothetical protein